jgi:hypothetical protein
MLGGCASVEGATSRQTPAATHEPAVETETLSAALQVYRSYIEASNAVDLGDPQTFALPGEFTTEDFHAEELAALSAMHDEGYVAGGAILIESFSVDSPTDGRTVVATTCNDVASVTLVDRRGESLLPLDGPDAYRMRLEFDLVGEELRLSSSVASVSGGSCAQ